MDFGLREWLFIFGLLVIAGILFDGWRRMGGRSKIRFKLERNLSDLPEEGGNDVFVHITAVQASKLDGLEEGQKVSYELEESRGKTAAVNLQLV